MVHCTRDPDNPQSLRDNMVREIVQDERRCRTGLEEPVLGLPSSPSAACFTAARQALESAIGDGTFAERGTPPADKALAQMVELC